jgi:hypothetical protein
MAPEIILLVKQAADLQLLQILQENLLQGGRKDFLKRKERR